MSKIEVKLFIELGLDNGGEYRDPPDNSHCWERCTEYSGLMLPADVLEQYIIRSLHRYFPWADGLPEIPELPDEPGPPLVPDPLSPPESLPPPQYLLPPFDRFYPQTPDDLVMRKLYIPSLWTKKSNYFYHYEGMNQGGCIFQDPVHPNKRPIRYNGMVQLPPILEHEIKVNAPQDRIVKMFVSDSGSSGNYEIEKPNGEGPWTIKVSNQFDPSADDHFFVWGQAVGGGDNHPEVMCDPIIRNRN